jgi:hypothetical protein
VKRIHLPDLKQYREDVIIVKLTERDYKKFLVNKGVLGMSEEVILHDPTKQPEEAKKGPGGRPPKSNT